VNTISGVFPLFEITEDGKVQQLATLLPLKPKGFRLIPKLASIPGAVYPDLPFFLTDLIPSGFLGRLAPKTHPELGLPSNIQLWGVDENLAFLSTVGWNLVGNLILGQSALNLYVDKKNAPMPPVQQPELTWHFPILAEQIQQEGDNGTSAPGDHPKFLIDYRQKRTSSLVKFSPPIQDEVSQRRADLLIAEQIASEVVSAGGIPTAHSKIIRVKNQIFLEIERFDRNEHQGRRGLISLQALGIDIGCSKKYWSELSAELLKMDKIDSATDLKIQELESFNLLIGNTKMDLTDLSFYFEQLRLGKLAPAYGMSPTCYEPFEKQIIPITLNLEPPTLLQETAWNAGYKKALEFWKRTSLHPEISGSFQKIAHDNHTHLETRKKPASKP
jgi:hypothetical protein